ncbi:TonB-dependent receptor [Gilvimarinus sp. 1_MG-2023]|uniref:TonB-dependent receptor n=1 Tax=Gilvimarinus sp. 1_MG-2023 TaxID=3062638 RepID=UPI0026E39CC4|nr:TonB-dependent receptor [Gilvimarinus sp. 1_MG-2023]MDO6746712.1 TonB-dependent receptor [Gilvimarinus sp. 1_MG-2023]
MAVSTGAYAQDALEEVIVIGTKASLERAQDIKRNADTVKDVITATDIGSLPDKSIVEALQRIPGVAIERFNASNDPDHFGVEGGKVVVRGLNRVRAEFNGRDALSARGDGGLSFSDIPPEMVGRVEVNKNQTADLIEGGVSGTINLVTRKPFDTDGLVLGGTIKASEGHLAEEADISASGLISNTWDSEAGRFGALLSVTQSELNTRSDGIGVYNYYDNNGVGGLASEYQGQDVAVPTSASFRMQQNSRDRLGVGASFQWESTNEDVLITAEFIHSNSDLTWHENFVEHPEQPFSGTPRAVSLGDDQQFDCPATSSEANPCLFTSGTLVGSTPTWADNVPTLTHTAATRVRHDEAEVSDYSLNGKFQITDNFSIEADLQYVDALNNIVDTTAHGKIAGDMSINMESDTAQLDFINTSQGANSEAYFADSANYLFRSSMDHVSENSAESLALAVDAEYTFDDDLFRGVKFGFRRSEREQDIRESDYNWGEVGEVWGNATYFDATPDIVEQVTFNDFHQGDSLTEYNTWWFPAVDSLSQGSDEWSEAMAAAGVATPTSWSPLSERSGVVDGTTFLPSEYYLVDEERTAIYARLDFGSDESALPFSGNVGLRYVSYDRESTGANNFPSPFSNTDLGIGRHPNLPDLDPGLPADVAAFANQESGIAEVQQMDTVNELLPSANLKLELTDNLLMRLAYSRAMFLPTMDKVRRNFVIEGNASTVDFTAEELAGYGFTDPDNLPDGIGPKSVSLAGFTANSAGNPLLEPEMSDNIDVSLEWYFSDLGSLTATYFNQQIEGFHRQRSTPIDVTNPSNGITQQVAVTQFVNAGDATIEGLELALQTTFGWIAEPLDNIGIQASYTYIDATARDDQQPEDLTGREEFTFRNFVGLTDLEGLSESNYNFTLFFDNGPIEARLAYTYRSEFLMHTRDEIAFSPVYGEATDHLDASISWDINDNFTLGLEANNLLDEVTQTSIQYNEEGVLTPRSYFVSDQRIGLFLKAKF